jgi:hypothetical protein
MRENWARKGMPPVHVDVKHRIVDLESDSTKSETLWIAGHHPYWGKTIGGWSGDETLVKRFIIKGPNPGMASTPAHEFPIVYFRK